MAKSKSKRLKSHSAKTKKSAHAVAGAKTPGVIKNLPNLPAVAPERDISQIPVLSEALDFITKDTHDRVLVKDFFTKCIADLKAKNLIIKISTPAAISTPGACYISNWPDETVTIWENNHIKSHMSLKDAISANIPACSPPRRK